MSLTIIPGTIADNKAIDITVLYQRLNQLETGVRELQSKLDTMFSHYFNINQPHFDYSLNWSLNKPSDDPINY